MSDRRRHRSFLVRATDDLNRPALALGLVVVAVMAVMVWVSIIAINGVPFSNPYKVKALVPAGAPLLKDGDEVRVAGRRAGQVRKVEVGSGGALLSIDLDQGPVGPGASTRVRLRGLAGAVYVELDRGDTSRPLPEGSTIPLRTSSTTTQLTDVVAGFRRDTRRALARTLPAYGAGLIGRGEDLNRLIGQLARTLPDTTAVLRAFAPRPGALADLLAQARLTTRGFAGPADARDLEALLPPGHETLRALGSVRARLGDSIAATPPLEDEVRATLPLADPLLADADAAVRALRPGVDELAATLPDLNALLGREADLARVSALARGAAPVLAVARPLVRELRTGALSLPPVARALIPLADYLARFPRELYDAPDGFRRWGGFRYAEGQASGSRAVRFSMILTCAKARDAYPAPGAAESQESSCRF
jgi:ABC-type transporter Mla subunit MlaD